jgi:hypothetical protein
LPPAITAEPSRTSSSGGIVDLVSTHRKELYKLPGLVGEVDDHGSDRIKKKVDQLMRGLGGGAGTAVVHSEGGARKKRKANEKADDGMGVKPVKPVKLVKLVKPEGVPEDGAK